jgi:predicted nucleic acid-binding protein
LKLTFVDTGVLIDAARGRDDAMKRAILVLDDPGRAFASSPLVKLEVLPKPIYNGYSEEAAYYEEFFKNVTHWAPIDADLVQRAYDEAVNVGLSALDALHVASAVAVGAEELVTTEKASKPLHRTKLVRVMTIHPG